MNIDKSILELEKYHELLDLIDINKPQGGGHNPEPEILTILEKISAKTVIDAILDWKYIWQDASILSTKTNSLAEWNVFWEIFRAKNGETFNFDTFDKKIKLLWQKCFSLVLEQDFKILKDITQKLLVNLIVNLIEQEIIFIKSGILTKICILNYETVYKKPNTVFKHKLLAKLYERMPDLAVWEELIEAVNSKDEIYNFNEEALKSDFSFKRYKDIGEYGIKIKTIMAEDFKLVFKKIIFKEGKKGEYEEINNLLKSLLSELRANDEIKIEEAVKVIKEEQKVEYVGDGELAEYIRNIVQQLPEFEYIRLKKSIRVKSFDMDKILKDLDSIFKKE